MEEKTSIILSHRREGMSIREIARRNGMSRKTVRKYLREFDRETGPSPTEREVDDYLLTRPKYDSSGRVRRVVTDDVRRRIDGFIARNRENVAAGLHKQQMRKLDMWRCLQDDGVRIAYSTVCQYVRALEAAPKSQEKPAKAYIRQDYEPGFRCEFDWGVLTLWIGGVSTRLHMAVFTLDHSNLCKAYLFSREDTLALMEAHRNCYRELGGTPRVMAHDNMRTAVKKFLGRDREHTDALPADARKALETLDFIKNGRNLILYGNPGTGKTHLATALGIAACNAGHSVLFTSVPRLLTQIRECRNALTLRSLENKFERYDMVICDEFGYVSCDKAGAEMLFNHLSLRTDKKTTVVTTNLAFNRWNEIIDDKVLVTAMVDRLTHKAILLNMTGKSYRMKETQEMMNQQI